LHKSESPAQHPLQTLNPMPSFISEYECIPPSIW
jgi:hypothetical protein